jgi:hypothetical protein
MQPLIRNLLNRIKGGVHAMPNSPTPIQDLIRQMLTIEVACRIQIDKIKCHPDFLVGLSPVHVISAPL